MMKRLLGDIKKILNNESLTQTERNLYLLTGGSP